MSLVLGLISKVMNKSLQARIKDRKSKEYARKVEDSRELNSGSESSLVKHWTQPDLVFESVTGDDLPQISVIPPKPRPEGSTQTFVDEETLPRRRQITSRKLWCTGRALTFDNWKAKITNAAFATSKIVNENQPRSSSDFAGPEGLSERVGEARRYERHILATPESA